MRLFSKAFDELHAETPFQLTYLQAYSRLREIESARGRREAPTFNDFDKSPQLIKVDVAHPKEFLIKLIVTTNLP
jgi:hypothetical protein